MSECRQSRRRHAELSRQPFLPRCRGRFHPELSSWKPPRFAAPQPPPAGGARSEWGRVVAGGRRPVAPVDPEATAAELADWADWLRTTYRLAEEVPPTWRTDPAAVAELAALHRAWQAAYAPAAGPTERLFWHDALARLGRPPGTPAGRRRCCAAWATPSRPWRAPPAAWPTPRRPPTPPPPPGRP